jgi:hypothetical protein
MQAVAFNLENISKIADYASYSWLEATPAMPHQ